jgi:hypothetical protein
MIRLIGWLQLVSWITVLTLIGYLILFRNSPEWYYFIKIGIGIQLYLLLLTSLLKRKLNIRWLIFNLILFCFIGFNELEINNIVDLKTFKGEDGYAMTYLFFVVIPVCMYIISVFFIIADVKEKK